jgi:hypothetical protein
MGCTYFLRDFAFRKYTHFSFAYFFIDILPTIMASCARGVVIFFSRNVSNIAHSVPRKAYIHHTQKQEEKTMTARQRRILGSIVIGVFVIAGHVQVFAQTEALPFDVQEGLFDQEQPDTLGLALAVGAETVSIFKPTDDTDKYGHGVILMPFKGHLYAQWQSSAQDEDAPDTRVMYSRSEDGTTWSEPMELVPRWDQGYRSSGGWWTDGDTLVAYANVWPIQPDAPRGGYVEYMTSEDGLTWSDLQPLLSNEGAPVNGIFEQDPHALPDGRIIGAVHEQPGLIVSPYYTDDPKGISGWTKGQMPNLPTDGTISRELEPSWFWQTNGTIVMIFRDQAGTFQKLASVSVDRGATWSEPVLTDMPDARTKQSAGNLPDGTAFMVGNPCNNKLRVPLAVTLSRDGKLFDKAFLLRSGGDDLQPLRYEGKYKRLSYSYPKSIVWNDFLYVSYATNKEDVELTRVPLASLQY